MLYGSKVNAAEPNDPLTMIVNLIESGSTVLDVGCGVGNLAAYLTETKRCTVTAVELSPVMAEMAKPHCENVLIGSIEDSATRLRVCQGGPYQYVVFADVLEHLSDPWSVLRDLRPALAAQGRILISVPNVAHWTVRMRLVFGKFDYTDGFLLDRGHLRFFTLSSARNLMTACGYMVEKERTRWAPLPGDRLWRLIPFLRDSVNGSFCRLFPGLFGYQFVFCLKDRQT